MSPRSERQHKAWGLRPRIKTNNNNRAREAGDSGCDFHKANRNDPAVARSAGLVCFADAYLGLTPQALC